MAISACQSTAVQYKVPALNEQDRTRLSCAEFPDLDVALEALPDHVFLADSRGNRVVTTDPATGETHLWVRFDRANTRETVLIVFAADDAARAHFVCSDNLQWAADLITGLEAAPD